MILVTWITFGNFISNEVTFGNFVIWGNVTFY